jgi:hypothetical protein
MNYAVFYVKKIGSIYESGSGTIISDLDPAWPKSTFPDRIRIHFRSSRMMLRVRFLEGLYLFLPDLTSVPEPFDAKTVKYSFL